MTMVESLSTWGMLIVEKSLITQDTKHATFTIWLKKRNKSINTIKSKPFTTIKDISKNEKFSNANPNKLHGCDLLNFDPQES